MIEPPSQAPNLANPHPHTRKSDPPLDLSQKIGIIKKIGSGFMGRVDSFRLLFLGVLVL